MNKHILLVMKWLNDSDSVTQEELKSNAYVAYTAHAAHADAVYAYAAANAAVYYAAADAAYHAYAAADAAYHAYAAAAAHAEKWVTKYFERSGEDRQLYVDALEEEKS